MDPNYNLWTKESLVKRIKLLEEKLSKATPATHATPVTPATPSAPPNEASSEQPTLSPTAEPAPPSTTPKPQNQPSKKRKKGSPNKLPPHSTRFIALKLAYLGRNYSGLEYQASGALPSIEEELWKALVKTCIVYPHPDRPDEVDFKSCEYSKCGRTDRGVSAFGQVVALRVKSNKPVKGAGAEQPPVAQGEDGAAVDEAVEPLEEAVTTTPDPADDKPFPVDQEVPYCKMLNAVLPQDIRVLAWCPDPPPGFSARHSCHERQYRYFFTQPVTTPLPAWLETPAEAAAPVKDGFLDLDAMRAAAKMYEGENDFRNFCKVDAAKQITNFKRLIREASIVEVPEAASALPYLDRPEYRARDWREGGEGLTPKVYYFHVRGSAFLWHQIRHMVAVLFLVGQGLEKPSIVTELLDVEKYPRKPNYNLASDVPLVLWDCLYGGRELPDGSIPADLEWVYAGADGLNPGELYSKKGLVDMLWAGWRDKKMDELLAGQLLQRATELADDPARRGAAAGEAVERMRLEKHKPRSVKVYEGDATPRLVSKYKPVAERQLLDTPEEVNDKWAKSKGFAGSAELRGDPMWRSTIKERAAAKRRGSVSAPAKDGGE